MKPPARTTPGPCPTCGCTLYQESGPCAGADLLEALKAVVDLSGVGHEDPDCPEDDTCECRTPKMVNAAIAKAEGR